MSDLIFWSVVVIILFLCALAFLEPKEDKKKKWQPPDYSDYTPSNKDTWDRSK